MLNTMQIYNLDYSKTLLYLKDNLPWANTLSVQLLKIIESSKGSFFTYISSPVNAEEIHQFRYSINNRVIKRHGVSSFIYDYLRNNNQQACFFEDVLKFPQDPHLEEFQECGFQYGKEVYYKISQDNLSHDLILDCLGTSTAIWHSLCVLTSFNECKTKTGILTLEMINQICSLTEIAIIGAYDDEGYIFWKKDE